MSYRENYKLIDFSKEIVVPEKRRYQPARSDMPCPMLISDEMPACEHVDGSWHTSKSGFRAVTKANGLIEVGNDPARKKPRKKPGPDEKAISDAVDRAVAQFDQGRRVQAQR